ncbi:MAG: cell surface protein SprA [Paraglaciecola sp.]|jgi:cell surface protein SprA
MHNLKAVRLVNEKIKQSTDNLLSKSLLQKDMRREYYLVAMVLLATIFSISTKASDNSRIFDNPYSEEFVAAVLDTIPLEDRTGDYITDPSTNPFDLKDPKIIDKTVDYDPTTNQYIITEKMGDEYFRPPSYMTIDEYQKYIAKEQEKEYFRELSGASGGQRGIGGRIDPLAEIDVKSSLVDRLFGGTDVNIQPQGSIDLTFGVDYSRTADPGRPPRQQRQGGFNFDMDIKMDVEGSIGEKLKLNTNYDTQATFDFDNVMKLQYGTDDFGEDEIIKSIEAGNVSLPLRGTLITGSESLFGLKVETQWGKLRLTGVASQQKSEREKIVIENGGQIQPFEVAADEYDENRHFFLTHYNRETYEQALTQLPVLNTNFSIEQIQVFVKPRGNVTQTYEILALTDLGETERFTSENPDFSPLQPVPIDEEDCFKKRLPLDIDDDQLYQKIIANPNTRKTDEVISALSSSQFNLEQGVDFEKVTAVLLPPSQYSYHPQLGFISLGINIPPDQVVGVSFRYSYQNNSYTVGEFTQDASSQDTTNQDVIICKMLKSTLQDVDKPAWDLMMKNIYSINGFQIGQEDFRLDITYDDPGNGEQRFLPVPGLDNQPILQLFGLDRLNVQNDPQPDGDGRFDFVEGVTILSRSGKIIFPKLEPFGSFIKDTIQTITGNAALAQQFSFDTLYTNTVTVAREQAAQNRFKIQGTYKSAVSADISLGAFNIPPNSERITAGGRVLIRDVDYTIDYTIGRVRILNEAILESGSKISIDFEDSALFGFQTKTMLGLRADYEVNKNLIIGGTFMQLFERPFTQKVNIGDDPINNKMYGLDLTYSNEAPWLTKLVDKIPLIDTKAPSSINFTAEAAYLKPGHSKAINEKADTLNTDEDGGVIYIDDFEGTTSNLDLRTPVNGPNGWVLASTPRNEMFPESNLVDNLNYGVNRALINWMRIEPQYQTRNGGNPYAMQIDQEEVFPNFTPVNNLQNRIISLDIQYCPEDRGPYNYDVPGGTQFSDGLNTNGRLSNPASRWGGIMRSLNNNDFQAANIEFVEFWMLNPYLNTDGSGNPNDLAAEGVMDGSIYFELGNISEDVLRDSRKFFENGLPGPNNDGLRVKQTNWGAVPVTRQITTGFDIDPANRTAQDVGFDGLSDEQEELRQKPYLDALTAGGVDPQVVDEIRLDPANDNYASFRADPDGTDAFVRYRRFFGSEGNSATQNDNLVPSSNSTLPDTEDLDRDNTLNELESYFQYKVPITYDGVGGIDVASNPYIIDQVESTDNLRTWYRFKIPLDQINSGNPNFKQVGGIQNFRSIRFMRMYMKDFQAKMNFRFATLDLVRNQWRRYQNVTDLKDNAVCPSTDSGNNDEILANFDVNTVSVEETSGYILPPGIIREQALGVNINALQNEQSLSMTACDLPDQQGVGIYKLVDMDMRQFKRMKMFVHGESTTQCNGAEEDLEDGALNVFVRLGSDFSQNYYEYEIPIQFTPQSSIDPALAGNPIYQRVIWPAINDLNIDFEALTRMKRLRNKSAAVSEEFIVEPGTDLSGIITRSNETYKIIGNPNLGQVKSILIGIRNPCNVNDGQDGRVNAEVWVNELRVFGLDEEGGAAATARLDMQLADFATVTLASKYTTDGWGQINDRVDERQREDIWQFDFGTQMELDRFLPEKWGVKVPFYFQYTREVETPEYDPYDKDILLTDKISDADDQVEKDLIREQAKTIRTIKTYNFTNVRKERTGDKKPMPWDVSNFSLSYNYEKTNLSDPYYENDELERERGALDYQYKIKSKPIKPFDKLIKNTKYLKFIKEINFNPLPNSFSFSTELDRKFNTTKYRFAGDDILNNTYFNKQFLWNRNYDLSWDLFKALKMRYFADFEGIIDEPTEKSLIVRNQLSPNDPNYVSSIKQTRRDSIFSNIENLGRPKRFEQNINLNFKVPLQNFPFMDWISATATYDGGYVWHAASVDPFALGFGNVIENNQRRSLKLDFKFDKLYKYSKYLKKIDSKPRKRRGGRRNTNSRDDKKKDGKDDKKGKKDKKDKKKKDREPSKIERALIRPLLMVRSLQLDFSEEFGTIVPGYGPDVDLFGMKNFESPGWDFVFGIQPNLSLASQGTQANWLDKNKQFIVPNAKLYEKVSQTKNDRYKAKLKIEPFKDFKLELNAEKSHQETHTERFAFDVESNDYGHAITNDMGTYEMTYFAMQTLFKKDSELLGLFNEFEDNRIIIANRLAPDEERPHQDSLYGALGFPYGYGGNHQSVSIPAFLAAYTGEDPTTVGISDDYTATLFSQLPRVNWRLNYTGLGKLPMFKNIFQSFKISHGYQSTLRVSSYQTNLDYVNGGQTYNTTRDNFNYYSRFNTPNLVISEAFSPLIGIDMRFKNTMSIRFESKKSRELAILFDELGQLSETRAEDWSLGFGYTLNGVEFGFLSKKKKKKKPTPEEEAKSKKKGIVRNRGNGAGEAGDLTLAFDFSLRDDITNEFIIDNEGSEIPSRGSTRLSINPSAEYRLNKQLSLRLFFDYSKTTPKTSIGFPQTNISSGVTVRFELQ